MLYPAVDGNKLPGEGHCEIGVSRFTGIEVTKCNGWKLDKQPSLAALRSARRVFLAQRGISPEQPHAKCQRGDTSALSAMVNFIRFSVGKKDYLLTTAAL